MGVAKNSRFSKMLENPEWNRWWRGTPILGNLYMFTIISDSCGLFDLGQQRQHPDAHLESVESMKVMDVEGLCVTCFGISGMKTQKNTLRLTQGFSSFPIGLSPTKF